MDMPSISLASITFNVTGSNLTDGLAYQLEVNKPMDRAYIVSVAIKVGHCSDKEISVEAALKLGDYLTMRPHEIKMVEGESSYMRDIVVECVGKCNSKYPYFLQITVINIGCYFDHWILLSSANFNSYNELFLLFLIKFNPI